MAWFARAGVSQGTVEEIAFTGINDTINDLPYMKPPGAEEIDRILALARDVALSRQNSHLLIHCHAGFWRSPAALALVAAQADPSLAADAIAAEVLRIRPNAWPNLRIIELGERRLANRGRRCFEPANKQLVASHQQAGEVIISPVTDHKPATLPMPDNRRPWRAVADVEQSPIHPG